MNWQLAYPSFWPEPRDPWAWQRALRTIAAAAPVPDPRPCWRRVLGKSLSRRSVAGLYGLRAHPSPATVLGMGLLLHDRDGWRLDPAGAELAALDRDAFQKRLGRLLVQRSAWIRLALRELSAARWTMPRGVAPLVSQRRMRVKEDLVVPDGALLSLPEPKLLLGRLYVPDMVRLETGVHLEALSALHAPLYLLHRLGWLNNEGRPKLPDEIAADLCLNSAAMLLRRITSELQDPAGFVPLSQVIEQLVSAVHGYHFTQDLASWTDRVIGGAIETGAIEIHAWEPGQPRHGRGIYGDRDRKLVRWTIHDDFEIPEAPTFMSREVEL